MRKTNAPRCRGGLCSRPEGHQGPCKPSGEARAAVSKVERLGSALLAIKQGVVAVTCEVCDEHMGYVEIMGCSDPHGPAGYCSKECIRAQAEVNVS